MTTHYPIDILHPATDALPRTINAGGRLIVLDRPQVMGIVNVTPDSFHASSRAMTEGAVEARLQQMLLEGADMVDVGACSTRPGAGMPTEDEEWERLGIALRVLQRMGGDMVVSVDTFRASIAERAVGEYGVHIVNDISGGTMDAAMFSTVARLGVPYVLTHIQGTPADMQIAPHYDNVTVEVTQWLAERVDVLHQMGVCDVIVDPGFGFGKTLEHNYRLLSQLYHLRHELDAPLMVGLSRKSMICRPLGIEPSEALNGTTVLNTLALERGADILRVHDVREAVQCVRLHNFL